jgi:2-methylcitrate dehydratase
MLDVRFKSVPANGPTASHVSATLALVREHDLRPADIGHVRIRCAVRESRHTTAPPKKYPRNAESADHSAFYANAHAIVWRSFGPESIEPWRFTDPTVLDLIERISVEADPQLASYQSLSRITTRDGRVLERRVDAPPGLGPTPFTDEQLAAKMTEMADRHMSAAQSRRLIDSCWNLDRQPDMRALTRDMTLGHSAA